MRPTGPPRLLMALRSAVTVSAGLGWFDACAGMATVRRGAALGC